ncbi:MAG: histidine triad nucleotide-binding protein [Candidatus Kapabacteria bacterium]|nr:histidine triad nucleotide-binding protein [Candidatus Kapabacteria bacterium]
MAGSIFTKIINREIPATIVYETDSIIAFRDIAPQAPVHILIVPKKEIPTVNDIQESDTSVMGELMLAAARIAAQEGIAEDGYRLIMNCNRHGGQEVYHLHCHLLGGKQLGRMIQ